jgi:DNA mismatch repair protein MSH5
VSFDGKDTMGAAMYNDLTCELELTLVKTSTCDGSDDMELTLEALKRSCQERPTTVLCSHRLDPAIAELLQREPAEGASGVPLVVVRSSLFQLRLAISTLATLRVHAWSTDSSERKCLIETLEMEENAQMAMAAGALCNWLARHAAVEQLDDAPGSRPISVEELRIRGIDDFVVIDEASLRALQIFETESHPSASLQMRTRAKEGFSIVGIFGRCLTPMGKRRFKQWCRKPLKETAPLNERFDAVAYLLEPSLNDACGSIRAHLRKVRDIPRILLRIKNVKATARDWDALIKSLAACYDVMTVVQLMLDYEPGAGGGESAQAAEGSDATQPALVREIVDAVQWIPLRKCAQVMSESIDMERSLHYDRVIVGEGVNQELDRLRTLQDGIPDLLRTVTERDFAPEMHSIIYPVQYCHRAHHGFVIELLVPSTQLAQRAMEELQGAGAAAASHALGLPADFQPTFCEQNVLNFVSKRTEELTKSVGDIDGDVIKCEQRLARAIEDFVLKSEHDFLHLTNAIARLDTLLSFALVAKEHSMVRPVMRSDTVLLIKNGRHPLQEITVKTFIPNDTILTSSKGLSPVAIVTGPNCSGKSVFLKQVGIIVFLAHIGCFVPAEEAAIGVVDRIFTRIQSTESVSLAQSAFTIDVKQIRSICQYSTPRSLLLVDEFGKGTNAVDGIALLAAFINSITCDAEARPRAIISTHFSEVFEERGCLLYPHRVALFRMTVYKESDETITPLFKIQPGSTTESFGLQCATWAGVDAAVVQRAKLVVEALGSGKVISPLESADPERRAIEANQRALVETFALERRWDKCSDTQLEELFVLLRRDE